jgi:hypothetical protein
VGRKTFYFQKKPGKDPHAPLQDTVAFPESEFFRLQKRTFLKQREKRGKRKQPPDICLTVKYGVRHAIYALIIHLFSPLFAADGKRFWGELQENISLRRMYFGIENQETESGYSKKKRPSEEPRPLFCFTDTRN